MGRRLLWDGVWRATHGGLWYPLREDARFGARVNHTTCNLPPPPTSSCTRTVLHVQLTGTPTYAQKSWGGHTRCDLAPLTTSFGTVGEWERQHNGCYVPGRRGVGCKSKLEPRDALPVGPQSGSNLPTTYNTKPPRTVPHVPRPLHLRVLSGECLQCSGENAYRRGTQLEEQRKYGGLSSAWRCEY